MARITVEDCLKKVNNRFALIHMASKRVRQLRKGGEPTIVSKNRDIVIALREIAAGTVKGTNESDFFPIAGEEGYILPEETGTKDDIDDNVKGQEDPKVVDDE
ncbi:DNA-directed RNA polymerase subunit omega [Thermodesulfobacteriota bacterium]